MNADTPVTAPVPADGGAATGGLGEYSDEQRNERLDEIRESVESRRPLVAPRGRFLLAEIDRLTVLLSQARAEGAAEERLKCAADLQDATLRGVWKTARSETVVDVEVIDELVGRWRPDA